jgi:outer membrane receptor for ferrienterochelin and colicins
MARPRKSIVTTVAMGRFRFTVISMLVLSIGTIPLYAQDSLQLKLLDPVVVTGQFEPQSLKKSVYQVRTISNERIQMRAAVNVQSILSTELGMRFTNDLTLGTADISLMGMSGQNVKILLDGVPLFDRGATRESLNQIDVNTIERIEIVEGPMSVVYGTDALAGVINIITRKFDGTQVAIDARIQEETMADEYEPFGKQGIHNENVSVNWQGKTWNAGGAITRNNSGGWQEGYFVPAESVQWHPKDQLLGMATVGFRRNGFQIGYRVNYLDETIKALGMANPTTSIATDQDYISTRYNQQIQTDWQLSGSLSFNGVVSYQDYSRRTRTTTYNVTTGDRRLSTETGSQSEAKFNTALLRGMFAWKISDRFSLQPGVDINLTEGAGDRIDATRRIDDYAVFVSTEFKPSSAVNIRPGLRFIHNSVYYAPPVIPSLNTRFALAKTLDLRLAYAHGFRAPALRELYFYFFDASHSIKGNPDLKAEYSNSFSASLAWQAYTTPIFKVNTTLGGFYNAFENLIDTGIDPANPQVTTYINVYRYKTTGGTLENNLVWRKLSATVGMSYIGYYNLLSEEDATLPAVLWTPEVNTTASYRFPKLGASINVFYKYTGKRANYEVVAVDNEMATRLAERESFHLADASISKKITSYLDLTGGVRNLLDVTLINNSSMQTGAHTTGATVPIGYGRSYFLTVNFHWRK